LRYCACVLNASPSLPAAPACSKASLFPQPNGPHSHRQPPPDAPNSRFVISVQVLSFSRSLKMLTLALIDMKGSTAMRARSGCSWNAAAICRVRGVGVGAQCGANAAPVHWRAWLLLARDERHQMLPGERLDPVKPASCMCTSGCTDLLQAIRYKQSSTKAARAGRAAHLVEFILHLVQLPLLCSHLPNERREGLGGAAEAQGGVGLSLFMVGVRAVLGVGGLDRAVRGCGGRRGRSGLVAVAVAALTLLCSTCAASAGTRSTVCNNPTQLQQRCCCCWPQTRAALVGQEHTHAPA